LQKKGVRTSPRLPPATAGAAVALELGVLHEGFSPDSRLSKGPKNRWDFSRKNGELSWDIPSGYHSHGKSPFSIGKPSISMGHFPWLC